MKSEKLRIYFAHPVNTYDTPLEHAMVTLINNAFPEYDVENPNQPHHQAAYAALAKRDDPKSTEHRGMDHFTKKTLRDPECIGCVALPFLNGQMGLGVAGEAKTAIELQKIARFIEPPVLHPADVYPALQEFVKNPLNGLFQIREFTEEEARLLLGAPSLKDNPPRTVVPHELTRLRTFLYYNVKPHRPYELAHLVEMPLPEDFYAYAKK